MARLLGCDPADIVFTSGGTESDNMALRGALLAGASKGRRRILTAATEHGAVRETAALLEQEHAGAGVVVDWIPVLASGEIDLEAFDRMLAANADSIALVSLMWVNNETGVIQPIDAIASRCHAAGVPLHTDAVQWAGKMPTNLAETPIDLLSLAAHKFRGPKGVGCLAIRPGTRVARQMTGGGQERGRRGGTENTPGICGMAAAAELALAFLAEGGPERQKARRLEFESRLQASLPGIIIHGSAAERTWSTSNIAFPGLETEPILLMLSERGLCAAGGAACSSGSLEPSPVLLAMGMPRSIASSSVRFSIGFGTDDAELERAAELIVDVVGFLGGISPGAASS